jgi:hypothetical protein
MVPGPMQISGFRPYGTEKGPGWKGRVIFDIFCARGIEGGGPAPTSERGRPWVIPNRGKKNPRPGLSPVGACATWSLHRFAWRFSEMPFNVGVLPMHRLHLGHGAVDCVRIRLKASGECRIFEHAGECVDCRVCFRLGNGRTWLALHGSSLSFDGKGKAGICAGPIKARFRSQCLESALRSRLSKP